MLSSTQNFKNTQNKPKLPNPVRERIRTEEAYEWILYRSFWDTRINAGGLMDQWIVGLQFLTSFEELKKQAPLIQKSIAPKAFHRDRDLSGFPNAASLRWDIYARPQACERSGDRWNDKTHVWELPYGEVMDLALEKRLVYREVKVSRFKISAGNGASSVAVSNDDLTFTGSFTFLYYICRFLS